ncbi:MAG: HdeD family acid-resistance protein [Devosia sp.]
MTISADTRRRFALATALRGAFMLLAGLYAVIWPAEALTIMVLAGGILLLVDGVLGLWSLTFGGGKSGNYWFDVISNVLSLVLGVLILISPLLATILTVSFMAAMVGIIALVVGVMQIVVITRERDHYARIWPVVLSGISYVLLGLVFLFFPLISASIGVIIGGVLLIMFSFGLFGWAWRLYKRSKTV